MYSILIKFCKTAAILYYMSINYFLLHIHTLEQIWHFFCQKGLCIICDDFFKDGNA